jgi:hypothetical protein
VKGVDRVTDRPPQQVVADLRALGTALDAAVPPKLLDRNLVMATWRWEMFDAVAETWVAGPGDRSPRDLRAIRALAEVVRRFDVVALQGLLGDARGLRLVMEALGDDWALMITGLSRESTYNERTAFVFDTRKVLPRGLAGQVVLPAAGEKQAAGADFLSRQFFRPPLFAGFRCLNQAFTLANIHLVYGKPEERVAELRAFVQWLREVNRDGYDWERNFIVLGQLQLMRSGTPLHAALTDGGLHIPDDLTDAATFVNAAGKPVSTASSIAWFGSGSGPAQLQLEYVRGGVFNFLADGLPFRDPPPQRYLSRHLPMWAEFDLRPSRRV